MPVSRGDRKLPSPPDTQREAYQLTVQVAGPEPAPHLPRPAARGSATAKVLGKCTEVAFDGGKGTVYLVPGENAPEALADALGDLAWRAAAR